jgi:MarR family transcriptional repressor of emrRAB
MTRSYVAVDVNYGEGMSEPRDARLVNLLGALATGLSDRMQDAAHAIAHLDGSAPAALIALLDFSPSGTVQTLSEICGLTHSGGVRLVDRLAAAGYVERGPGRNARSVTVTLTSAGRTVALELRAARRSAIAGTIEALSARQRIELARACDSVITALTQQRLAQRAGGETPAGGALCRMCDFGACGRDVGDCPAARTADPSR